MWLFTQFGFYSIVRKQDGIHVRGRVRKDLENLKAAAKLEGEILDWRKPKPGGYKADYPYRIILTDNTDLRRIMCLLADILDYPNFKGHIEADPIQRERDEAYFKVWDVMRRALGNDT
ncbi:MAG: hypothetical protein IT578_10570 [Verrucomicrobiae bacterium]|nr:hypothetical protein [Verrucomicrobiae bacterium]